MVSIALPEDTSFGTRGLLVSCYCGGPFPVAPSGIKLVLAGTQVLIPYVVMSSEGSLPSGQDPAPGRWDARRRGVRISWGPKWIGFPHDLGCTRFEDGRCWPQLVRDGDQCQRCFVPSCGFKV